jgi:2-dehydropantoate 2-reductase
MMKIAVIGAGGVGGYFGGRLAQAGHEVIFIARGAHLAAIQRDGLRVDSIKGDFLVHPTATADPAEVGPADVVLVAVKAWQVPEVALQIPPLLGPETMVVPLQNGVEAPDQLRVVLPAKAVLGGLCRIFAFIEAPGHIRHVGTEPYIAFGEWDNIHTSRAEGLLSALVSAGIRAEIPPNIQVAMWNKFIFIAAMSGVGAVTRAPIGVVRSLPATRGLLENALREAQRVAQALSIAVPETIIDNTLQFIDKLDPTSIASMQRDIMEGRPSELEAQNGAVVRLGEAVGVAVPTHQFIYHSLLPLELLARQQINFAID